MLLDEIITLLSSSKINPLLYLVKYGSEVEGSDLDLFAVYSHQLSHVDYSIGKLDVFAIDNEQFQNLLALHDIIVKEPLLTGELIYGDIENWTLAKGQLFKRKPDANCFFHLQNQMNRSLSNAEHFLGCYQRSDHLLDVYNFYNNLSFGLSYFYCRKKYLDKQYEITLRDLEIEYCILENVRSLKKSCYDNEIIQTIDEMEKLLFSVKELIVI